MRRQCDGVGLERRRASSQILHHPAGETKMGGFHSSLLSCPVVMPVLTAADDAEEKPAWEENPRLIHDGRYDQLASWSGLAGLT